MSSSYAPQTDVENMSSSVTAPSEVSNKNHSHVRSPGAAFTTAATTASGSPDQPRALRGDLYPNPQAQTLQQAALSQSDPTHPPDTLASPSRQQQLNEPYWDNYYNSFFDLAHFYELQGELADQRQDLIQDLDDEVPPAAWDDNTTIAAPVHVSGAHQVESSPVSTTTAGPPHRTTIELSRPATTSFPPPPRPTSRRPRTTPTPRRPEAESNPKSNSPANRQMRRQSTASASMARMSNSQSASPNHAPPHPSNVEKVPDDSVNKPRMGTKKTPEAAGFDSAAALFSTGGVLRQQANASDAIVGASKNPTTLPPEKVFPIQIGSELYRLSGASISSDAPSYFSHFFEEQLRQTENGGNLRTLYIDRDPVTFREICRHLQGYHVRPKDGAHFVKLFADAQFYSLPRLVSQLFESEIFIQIGDRHFQIPRDVFSGPGDSPNFFSLGFAIFFASPSEVFPGLDRKGLLRPPSIVPPSVPHRSGDIFAQLLHLLRGYPLHIENEDHRAELLRDCRYFHLRGLEQKLIPYHISYNPERERSEIVVRLEDIRQSGVQFVSDVSPSDSSPAVGWVHYSRPFVDDHAYELIIEIGGQSMVLDLESMRADFRGLVKARIASLVQVVANKLNLPTKAPLGLMMMAGGASKQAASPGHTPLSEDRPKIRIERDADITVNGEPYAVDAVGFGTGTDTVTPGAETPVQPQPQPQQQPPAKRKRVDESTDLSTRREQGEWLVYKGQWRLRIQPNPTDLTGRLEIVFYAVKLDVYIEQRARNRKRAFLAD